ncbi:hypothetical protein ABIC01_005592 [Bradyrhizobium sp. RT4b]
MPDVCGLAPEFPFRMSRAVRDGLPRLVGLVGASPSLKREMPKFPSSNRSGRALAADSRLSSCPRVIATAALFRLRQIQSTPAGTRSLPFVSITVTNPRFSSARTRWSPACNSGSPPVRTQRRWPLPRVHSDAVASARLPCAGLFRSVGADDKRRRSCWRPDQRSQPERVQAREITSKNEPPVLVHDVCRADDGASTTRSGRCQIQLKALGSRPVPPPIITEETDVNANDEKPTGGRAAQDERQNLGGHATHTSIGVLVILLRAPDGYDRRGVCLRKIDLQ